MIEIKNISKSYGEKNVVDNVSTLIREGKITAFIGPNGAGKSTLLSVISRLIPKKSGEVIIDGRRMEEWKDSELAKKISILKQSNNINIRLTVEDLVAFGRFPYSQGKLTKEDERVIEDSINYLKLGGMKDKYLDELSGGQRQRAYIAMILAQDTDYILLDEPLNNLDMKHSVEIMKILRRLVDELGKTIAIVIHDINFASCYSDFIVALKNGRVVEDDAAEKIIEKSVLEKLFDMDFDITKINDMKLCVYY
ncbi:MAG TPA: iron ABC transporter ATP-binding protein [Clostridiales bacterium]|nr:iron ABC transporter ATP-binding protein [Clostridiales bacterium]